MKPTKVITSTNENTTYTHFIPLMCTAWKKLFNITPIIAVITDKDVSDPFVQSIKKHAEVVLYKPIPGVVSGVQAKISRMVTATNYLDDNCMVVDLDMIPLHTKVLEMFEEAPDDKFIRCGANHYLFHIGPDDGKWPMDRTTAPGKIWKDIVNPKNLEYEDLIKSWFDISYGRGHSSVNNPMDRFSDESLLRYLHTNWNKPDLTYDISRSPGPTGWSDRVDRAWEESWNFTIDDLKNGKWIDIHGFRPLQDHLSRFKVIFDYFQMSDKDIKF